MDDKKQSDSPVSGALPGWQIFQEILPDVGSFKGMRNFKVFDCFVSVPLFPAMPAPINDDCVKVEINVNDDGISDSSGATARFRHAL